MSHALKNMQFKGFTYPPILTLLLSLSVYVHRQWSHKPIFFSKLDMFACFISVSWGIFFIETRSIQPKISLLNFLGSKDSWHNNDYITHQALFSLKILGEQRIPNTPHGVQRVFFYFAYFVSLTANCLIRLCLKIYNKWTTHRLTLPLSDTPSAQKRKERPWTDSYILKLWPLLKSAE